MRPPLPRCYRRKRRRCGGGARACRRPGRIGHRSGARRRAGRPRPRTPPRCVTSAMSWRAEDAQPACRESSVAPKATTAATAATAAVVRAVAAAAATPPPRQHGIGGRARPPLRRTPAHHRRRHPRWGADEAPSAARGRAPSGGRGTAPLPPRAWRPRSGGQPPRFSFLGRSLRVRACRQSVAATWVADGGAASLRHPTPLQWRRGGGHHPVGRDAVGPVGRTTRCPRCSSDRASARARRQQRRAAAAARRAPAYTAGGGSAGKQ